ncbi:prokaryote ATPase domain containing protein [Pseudohyphozyma bogoriensis]|nr:prokaryote ATPase domain containing protein [Pseudohyphozyma bogoriensis]
MKDQQEKAQIPAVHAFSPLPGFYDRPREIRALEKSLEGVPAFTVLFGASSVGKTALLRQVLSSDKYHVIHLDLRIAGFADLESLYFCLAQQLEAYFAAIPELMGREWGWGEFEKESWAFKHDRLGIERRVEGGGNVRTSDIAHLMELYQSALLKYWEFQPMTQKERDELEQAKEDDEEGSKKNPKAKTAQDRMTPSDPTESRMREAWGPPTVDLQTARTVKAEQEAAERKANGEEGEESEKEETPPPKRIPVLLLDEAHKLPALINADDAMKRLLDSMLVLTKQDRLTHIVHATSDSFYMRVLVVGERAIPKLTKAPFRHWLRQLNIMQHCHIISIGDVSKSEARAFFETQLLPHIPERLAPRVPFEGLYKVFGGKLAHLADYVTEFINSDGNIDALHSSHFLQAHSLINLQLIHSRPTHGDAPGFEIYSPLKPASPHASESPFVPPTEGSDFSESDLLTVMKRLAPTDETGHDTAVSLPYFPLCRELGAKAVDGMVMARILELRWSDSVTAEGDSSDLISRKMPEALGPSLFPTTPVVAYAMGIVLKEYENEGLTERAARKGGETGK